MRFFPLEGFGGSVRSFSSCAYFFRALLFIVRSFSRAPYPATLCAFAYRVFLVILWEGFFYLFSFFLQMNEEKIFNRNEGRRFSATSNAGKKRKIRRRLKNLGLNSTNQWINSFTISI